MFLIAVCRFVLLCFPLSHLSPQEVVDLSRALAELAKQRDAANQVKALYGGGGDL